LFATTNFCCRSPPIKASKNRSTARGAPESFEVARTRNQTRRVGTGDNPRKRQKQNEPASNVVQSPKQTTPTSAAEESDNNASPSTNSVATNLNTNDLQDAVDPPHGPAAVTVTPTVMRAILELKSCAANYKLIIKSQVKTGVWNRCKFPNDYKDESGKNIKKFMKKQLGMSDQDFENRWDGRNGIMFVINETL
jgi:hypothetical protein